MPETVFEVDTDASPEEQPDPIVNRWHPDTPPASTVQPGEKFRVECLDWTGGQVNNDDSANDIRDMDLTPNHHLSGPIEVEGAEPGDLLVVDILDIGAFPDHEWGFTGIFELDNGGGFLTDHFPNARKSIWDLDGVYTKSRHIPGVEFAGLTHPGILGTAPSHELLEEWNRREQKLIDDGPEAETAVNHETREEEPPLALPPEPENVMLGSMDGEELEEAKHEAARTIPPRENAGNCDIKNLSRGSRVYLPVFVDGANFITGDIHFSQGDGEITFCGAIEMAGWIDFRVDVIKGGMEKFGLDHAIFKPGNVEPDFSEYITFEGTPANRPTSRSVRSRSRVDWPASSTFPTPALQCPFRRQHLTSISIPTDSAISRANHVGRPPDHRNRSIPHFSTASSGIGGFFHSTDDTEQST
jgi:formamidase